MAEVDTALKSINTALMIFKLKLLINNKKGARTTQKGNGAN